MIKRIIQFSLIALVLSSCARHHNHPVLIPFDGPVANSPSMVPTIMPGQRIHVDHYPFDQIKVGDIIVFWDSALELSVCHRVIDIRHVNGQTAFITRGDNNHLNRDLHLVTTDNYLGKVTKIYPLDSTAQVGRP